MVTQPTRPVLVSLVYGLGLLAATILVMSALFTTAAYFAADDESVGLNVSPLAFVVWGGLSAVAAVTWLWRRRRIAR